MNKFKLILFADDTSIIVTNPNPTDFIKDINTTFKNINEWFKANLLSLNFDKTNFIQFITKNSSRIDVNVGCDNNLHIMRLLQAAEYRGGKIEILNGEKIGSWPSTNFKLSS
jgi:hypothetical protein